MARKASSVMRPRFEGVAGRERLIEALSHHSLLIRERDLAAEVADVAVLQELDAQDELIAQGACDNDIYLIVSGELCVRISGREVARRGAGSHVGEMALIDPVARRSASVAAVGPALVARISESDFSSLARKWPELWRRIAVELAERLRQRSSALHAPHNQPVVFIGSSSEGRDIAQHVHNVLCKEPVVSRIWSEGVFTASKTTIESLVGVASEADFAVLVFTLDDVTASRGRKRPSPRDNVVFELGLLMGAIGRERAYILKPHDADIRIPSDLLGLTCLGYATGDQPVSRRLRAACRELVELVNRIGPR